MGNLCGKTSKEEDNFTGPGRVLGSAPAPQNNAKASVPASQQPKQKPVVGGPGRTLGESSGDVGDARSAAARAAEVRSLDTVSLDSAYAVEKEHGNRKTRRATKPFVTTGWM
jgi:hypothetical protein